MKNNTHSEYPLVSLARVTFSRRLLAGVASHALRIAIKYSTCERFCHVYDLIGYQFCIWRIDDARYLPLYSYTYDYMLGNVHHWKRKCWWNWQLTLNEPTLITWCENPNTESLRCVWSYVHCLITGCSLEWPVFTQYVRCVLVGHVWRMISMKNVSVKIKHHQLNIRTHCFKLKE